MPQPVSFQAYVAQAPDVSERAPLGQGVSDLGKRFEQMLWTEMLSYAGLDKAFAQDGGQAAETFSRYVIESIAADLAETHPMGLGEAVDRTAGVNQSPRQGDAV
nr:hypothetical protein [uncultured Hyphomonas sp.]